MRVKSNLISLVCFVLFFSMPVLAQSNLSVQELKDQYNWYNKIVNDPDIFWIVSFDDYNQGKFVNREQFEKFIMQNFIIEGKETLEEKIAAMTYHTNVSQKVKADIRHNLLPELEFLIKERANSPNPHVNLNDNTQHYPNDTSSNSSSFMDAMAEMSSDEHLNALSFDNILASGNGGGTAIQDSQTDSYDGNWNNAGNDNYSSCPKTKPDDRSSFKAYPNGQTSGGTYRHCAYFGNGYLKLEDPYINGKRDGLQTIYTWSNKQNFSYVSQRTNYSNGKRNGLRDFYALSNNGAVYRTKFITYSDGMQHGDSAQWYDNGQTMKETNFFEGRATLQYNYKKDGSFNYCTKWDKDRTIRDCKTGKIRRF